MLLDVKKVIKNIFIPSEVPSVNFLFIPDGYHHLMGRQWQLCQQWNTHNYDGYSVHKNLSALNIKELQNGTRFNFNIYHSNGQKDLTCMLLKWNGKVSV